MTEKAEKYLNNGYKKFGAEFGVPPESISFHCSLDNTKENIVVKVLKNFQPQREITVQDITGINIDFLQVNGTISVLVAQKLVRESRKMEIPIQDIGGIIMKEGNGSIVWIYNKTKPIQKFSLEQLMV